MISRRGFLGALAGAALLAVSRWFPRPEPLVLVDKSFTLRGSVVTKVDYDRKIITVEEVPADTIYFVDTSKIHVYDVPGTAWSRA